MGQIIRWLVTPTKVTEKFISQIIRWLVTPTKVTEKFISIVLLVPL